MPLFEKKNQTKNQQQQQQNHKARTHAGIVDPSV